MEINVMIVPETIDFLSNVLIDNKIWINKNLGEPRLLERNVKYIAPYWLSNESDRGVNRIYHILDMTSTLDGKSYEITLGNSFNLIENWHRLDQFRRFQYVPLSEFKLRELAEGILVPAKENNKIERVRSTDLLTTKKEDRFFSEFWIGKEIKLKKYWKTYYEGFGYIEKFKSSNSYILEISFSNKPKELPLFNLEPVNKTLKAFYYHAKKTYLPITEFELEGPLYLQEVSRGSEIITWLANGFLPIFSIAFIVLTIELKLKKLQGQKLSNSLIESKIKSGKLNDDLTNEKIISHRIKNLHDRLEFLKEHHPNHYQRIVNNTPPKEIIDGLNNLVDEGINKIRFTKNPVNKLNFDKESENMEEIEL